MSWCDVLTINVTEVVLTQMFFLQLLLNKRNKYEKNVIPWYLHTIQKSALLITRESNFSAVWVMELSIISLCLVKDKVFLIIIAANLSRRSTFA